MPYTHYLPHTIPPSRLPPPYIAVCPRLFFFGRGGLARRARGGVLPAVFSCAVGIGIRCQWSNLIDERVTNPAQLRNGPTGKPAELFDCQLHGLARGVAGGAGSAYAVGAGCWRVGFRHTAHPTCSAISCWDLFGHVLTANSTARLTSPRFIGRPWALFAPIAYQSASSLPPGSTSAGMSSASALARS